MCAMAIRSRRRRFEEESWEERNRNGAAGCVSVCALERADGVCDVRGWLSSKPRTHVHSRLTYTHRSHTAHVDTADTRHTTSHTHTPPFAFHSLTLTAPTSSRSSPTPLRCRAITPTHTPVAHQARSQRCSTIEARRACSRGQRRHHAAWPRLLHSACA